jgi:hypothetical protein
MNDSLQDRVDMIVGTYPMSDREVIVAEGIAIFAECFREGLIDDEGNGRPILFVFGEDSFEVIPQ